MKNILLSILVICLLAITAISASADPYISPNVPNQIKDEDSAPWTLDLSAYEHGDSGETDSQLSWSRVGTAPTKFSTSFDLNNNIITFTPVANAYGSEIITLRLTNTVNLSYVEQDITVTLNPVNDPAQWTVALTSKAINEDVPAGTFVYSGIKLLCTDIDSPITVSATSTDVGHYTLYMLGDNLAIKDLESNYNSVPKRVYAYCNGVESSFFLTITSMADAPYITSTIPDQFKNTNDAPWALDLSAYEGSRDGETDLELDWSVTGVDTTLYATSFDSNLNIITFTPVASAVGSDVITLTLTGLNGQTTQDITVTLAPAGAPVLTSSIPTQTWEKGTSHTLDLRNYFEPDTGATYSLASAQPADITLTIASTGVVTYTPKVNTWVGTNTVKFRVTNAIGSADSNNVNLVFQSTAPLTSNTSTGLCEVGQIGSLLSISDITIEDDELKPGDTIEVEVEVENNDDENMKVVVEATLFNVDKNKKVSTEESESISIDDGDTEKFTIDLPVGYDDNKIGDDDNYELRIKAYKSSDEDEQCVQSTEETVDITREDDDVIVETYAVSSTSVNPGSSIDVTVDLRNIGIDSQDGVFFKARETTLGIDMSSSKVDLEAYDDSDNTASLSRTIVIPTNAKAGAYQLEVIAYYGNGQTADSIFVPLIVSGTPSATGAQPQVTVEPSEQQITGQAVLPTSTTYTPISDKINYVDVLLVAGIVILVSLVGLFVKVLFFSKKP